MLGGPTIVDSLYMRDAYYYLEVVLSRVISNKSICKANLSMSLYHRRDAWLYSAISNTQTCIRKYRLAYGNPRTPSNTMTQKQQPSSNVPKTSEAVFNFRFQLFIYCLVAFLCMVYFYSFSTLYAISFQFYTSIMCVGIHIFSIFHLYIVL